MADIAQLGFAADTGALKDAKASLDALVPSAVKVEAAAERVGNALDDTARGADNAARGLRNASDAAGSSVKNVTRIAEGYDLLTGKISGNFLGISNNLQKLNLIPNKFDAATSAINKTNQAIKFTAIEGLNASRQLADIGVTALAGMNPFLIAVQQGPQLFDILQNKAVMTGSTIGAVFRAAGAAIWTALAPLLPLILGIAAVVGTIATAFVLGTREINKGNQSVIDGMGLTEKQLERVKKSGVDTAVTVGDTFFAFFSVIGDRLTSAFDGPLSWLKDAWNSTLDFIVKYGAKAIEFIVGGFTGAVYAIKAAWGILPAALGDITISAANATIAGIEWMINKAVDGLNGLIGFANSAAEKMGLPGFGTLEHSSLGRQSNPYAGQAKALGSAVSSGFAQGFKDSKGMVDRFWSDVDKKARQNARDRIKAVAGDPGAGAKDKAGGKSDGEKFDDIVKGAERDIAAQNARATATDLSAEAATKLEYQTKLLNEAQQKGIKLTDGMRSKIDELAGAYARAKTAADNAVGLRDVLKAADGDIANIKAQADMIGLYGRELAYATEMQKLLNEAKQKGMTADAIAVARPQFEAKANQYADASASLEHDKFIEETIRKMDEETYALQRQRGEFGLAGEALVAYRYETDILADAKRRNIDLTAAEIAAIGQSAQIYAAQVESIRKTTEAIAFGRETFKGFFNQLRDGLAQGQSAWSAFADAAENALNRILDKLLDTALDSALNGILSGFGIGGGSKLNPVDTSKWTTPSGPVIMNAKGNAFGSSGIVDKPTMFAFGKGGANIGIMGEASEEAIMPLTRGPDGSLGVQMHGGADQGSSVFAPQIDARATYVLSGAISSGEIAAAIRQSGDDVEKRVTRKLPQVLNEYQRNGTTG